MHAAGLGCISGDAVVLGGWGWVGVECQSLILSSIYLVAT